jgi:hypothetical protein
VSRDYGADMTAICRDWLGRDDVRVNAELAQKILADLDATDPDLINGWARLTAAQNLTALLRSLDGRERRQARSVAFGAAREEYEATGDAGVFAAVMTVTEDNVRKRIGAMTRDDHLYVASRYVHTAKTARMEAAFHRAVAKRLAPGQTTSDVMDETTYLRLRESLTARTT